MNKLFKTCEKCGESKSLSEFLPTRNILFPDGRTSICITCVEDLIEDNNGELNFMDGLCRTLDIAFEPERWLEYYKANGAAALLTFIETSLAKTYPTMDDINTTPITVKNARNTLFFVYVLKSAISHA